MVFTKKKVLRAWSKVKRVGSDPVSGLFEKLKVSSLKRLLKVDGMVPVNLLLAICKNVNCVKSPSSDGIVPNKSKLPEKLMELSVETADISLGQVPLRSFSAEEVVDD